MESFYCLDVLHEGIETRAMPSAAVAVGRGKDIYIKEVMGHKTTAPLPIPVDIHTRYDLASLTKLVSTTMVALKLVEQGKLLLTHTLSRYFSMEPSSAYPEGRGDITLFQLMTHTSGLTPHMPLWKLTHHPKEAANAILMSPPVCPAGTQVHYSCMGYILLAKILEMVAGESLDVLAQKLVFGPLGMAHTGYCPGSDNVATTEFSPLRNVYIAGEVHDENAHYLGGVSGNAGVFSDLGDMIRFAQMLSLKGEGECGRFLSPSTFALATQNHTSGLSESRGLGFQLKPPMPCLSAMGDLMTKDSYGHTGFTGTSLYVDAADGLWGVLLTNAVHFGRDKTAFFDIRRRFYNAMRAEF
ncbi:MAG: beta-lactamase family protein [Ruminococcaceae bacterium]|nr:beta-lactamase family protein [Oscillospiraceae bacterium]